MEDTDKLKREDQGRSAVSDTPIPVYRFNEAVIIVVSGVVEGVYVSQEIIGYVAAITLCAGYDSLYYEYLISPSPIVQQSGMPRGWLRLERSIKRVDA